MNGKNNKRYQNNNFDNDNNYVIYTEISFKKFIQLNINNPINPSKHNPINPSKHNPSKYNPSKNKPIKYNTNKNNFYKNNYSKNNFCKNNSSKNNNNNKNDKRFDIVYILNSKNTIIKNTLIDNEIYINKKVFNYFGKNKIKPTFYKLIGKMKNVNINRINDFKQLWNSINEIIKNLNSDCDGNRGYLKPEEKINFYMKQIENKINNFFS